MNKFLVLLVFFLVLLAVPFSLPAYDDSPNSNIVIPECIWAAATGGGTWVTEIQVTSMSASADVYAHFFYGGGGLSRGPFLLTDLAKYHSVKYNNILQTMDGLDPDNTFSYYGRVGAIYFSTDVAPFPSIQVTAKTVNGNYGKTLPGLSHVAGNTAAVGRRMRIPLLVNNATYRTFTGFFNTSVTATYTVTFTIISGSDSIVGASFSKTFPPLEYMAFNPFVEAGVGAGTYDNCWLDIVPTAGGSDERGIMCFGATANNITQDPSALIAYPWAPEE